ncbi:MAG: hypothetical protein JWM21_3479 [Acidobacteria bacterium]|nr:hypothetical protein [Acidobacteriota bacterium]
MNSSQTQHSGSQSNRRGTVLTLSLSLVVCFNLLPVIAQVRSPKRITSVWTATTAEGSRVHVVSDAPVNDYEGYTRGGRFYVKIPLADLPTARGSLLGRGFDDVQIQRYGDGIIISFRLQPGTSARVEQAANRLEIVFTTPAGSRSAVAGARETDDANRTRARRIADSAGPSPATSPASAREERSIRRPSGHRHLRSGAGAVGTTSRVETARNSGSSGVKGSKPERDSRNSGPAEKGTPTRPNTEVSSGASTSARPTPAATPTRTPSSLSGSASPAGTPASVATPRPSESYSQLSSSPTPNKTATTRDNDWKSRAHYWRVWAELNWLPILIGVLVALALLVLLFFWRAAKRSRGDAADWDESSNETVASTKAAPESLTAGASQSVDPTPVAPVQTQTAAAGQTHSSNAAPSEQVNHQGEEAEREVFEL